MTEMKFKRNFCIVAHIDHGKSTLSDRLIQKAKIIDDRKMMNQILDNMDIERERGITIKSQAVTIPYHAKDGNDYELNFVDTPGHVDFSYEVSRAIASCEGALLLIDATQGVESQTVSNMYMALEHDLTMVPVINKIDLASADIPACKAQIDNELGLDSADAMCVSAKTGEGIDELKQEIYKRFASPSLVEGGVIVTNERHKQALSVAVENINNAIREIDGETLDLISIDLKLAYSALGEITGNTTGEDIIDAIFSKFCLGK